MIKWTFAGLLSMLFSVTLTTAQAHISPTELKMDHLMAAYVTNLQQAFQEKEDQKTIALLQHGLRQLEKELNHLKPELDQWNAAIKAMDKDEKEALTNRMQAKPYFKTAFELIMQPAVMQRVHANALLAKALRDGSGLLPTISFVEASNE